MRFRKIIQELNVLHSSDSGPMLFGGGLFSAVVRANMSRCLKRPCNCQNTFCCVPHLTLCTFESVESQIL